MSELCTSIDTISVCPPTDLKRGILWSSWALVTEVSRSVSICQHLKEKNHINPPGFLVSKSVLRCSVDGRSLRRSDSCLLKGEFFWLRAGNPRNEPWRTSCSMGAWRRGMAWGPPGSGRSMGDAAPSGGEAVPGGRAGIAEGWSGWGRVSNGQNLFMWYTESVFKQ